jgi:hypothetical protein
MPAGYNFLFHTSAPLAFSENSTFNTPTNGFPKEVAKECSISVTWQLLPLASVTSVFATVPFDPINPVEPRTGGNTWKTWTGVIKAGETEGAVELVK